jgi:hypothetical protein
MNAMTKPHQPQDVLPGYYLYDPRGHVTGLSEIGVAAETERCRVVGGGLVDLPEDDRPPSIAVLHAPSMPHRFRAVEITGEGMVMIRNDGVRCAIHCDPLLADEVALRDVVTILEAGDQRHDCLSYEVAILAEHEHSMRM